MVLAAIHPARADMFAPRPDWNVGISWGYGPASIDGYESLEILERDQSFGGSPHVQLGRMLGQKAMLSVHWKSWITEFGNPPAKIHLGLQALSMGVGVFPGDPRSAWGGLFVRAGVGIANSVTGAKEVEEDTPQDLGIRVIDKGFAYFGEIGYEIRLPHEFSLGLKTTIQQFEIGGFFVDSARVVSTVVDLGMYF